MTPVRRRRPRRRTARASASTRGARRSDSLAETPHRPRARAGRRCHAVPLREHPAAARIGDFERALDCALRHQHVDVRAVEANQLRQERQLVVGFQEIRARFFNRRERRLEVARRLLALAVATSPVRPGRRGPPTDRRRLRRPASASANSRRAVVELSASGGNPRGVQRVPDTLVRAAGRVQPIGLLVGTLGIVPPLGLDVRRRQVARPEGGILRQVGSRGDRQRALQVGQRARSTSSCSRYVLPSSPRPVRSSCFDSRRSSSSTACC